MTKMTSAVANKMLRKLNEDKEFQRAREQAGYLYVAALDEEPVIPDYNYAEVAAAIEEIDDRILRIKHAINLSNCTNEIEVCGTKLTIDAVLVKMAQRNRRKATLDEMRKHQPKERINSGMFSNRKTAPEYQYINYDLAQIQQEYEKLDEQVTNMQIALDKYNQTVEFEVDI